MLYKVTCPSIVFDTPVCGRSWPSLAGYDSLEPVADRRRRFLTDAVDIQQVLDRGVTDVLDVAEPAQQATSSLGADARNPVERRRNLVAERLVVLDSEAVGLVADALADVEVASVARPVEDPVGGNDQLPLFGQRDRWHVPPGRFEGVDRRTELALAAVDEQQVGIWPVVPTLDPSVGTPPDQVVHVGVVVVAVGELLAAVVARLGAPADETDVAPDDISALRVAHVEAFD